MCCCVSACSDWLRLDKVISDGLQDHSDWLERSYKLHRHYGKWHLCAYSAVLFMQKPKTFCPKQTTLKRTKSHLMKMSWQLKIHIIQSRNMLLHCILLLSCQVVTSTWNMAGPVITQERRGMQSRIYRKQNRATPELLNERTMADHLSCQLIRTGYDSLIGPRFRAEHDTLACLKRSGVARLWSFARNHSHSQQ